MSLVAQAEATIRPSGTPRVLVLTADLDPTCDVVLAELTRRRVPFTRLDPGDFPTRIRLSARLVPGGSGWTGELAGRQRRIRLEDIRAVYWRRPSPHAAPIGLEADEVAFALREARLGLDGVLLSLPGVLHLNDPRRVAVATKGAQLVVMTSAGLAVPDSWIGNDPAGHGLFCTQVGAPVSKTLGPITIGEGQSRRVMYTAPVPRHRWGSPRATATANLVQARVTDVALEVRAAVVGTRIFATEIHRPPGTTEIDVRAERTVSYRPGKLPEPVAESMLVVMRHFGLTFAAWDLLVRRDGSHVALELNASGQWAFTPNRDQITAALCDKLQEAAQR